MIASKRARHYAILQLVPICTSLLIWGFVFYDHQFLKAGNGDDALLPLVIVLLPIYYLVLPGFLIFNVIALKRVLEEKAYFQSVIILVGILSIVATYHLFPS